MNVLTATTNPIRYLGKPIHDPLPEDEDDDEKARVALEAYIKILEKQALKKANGEILNLRQERVEELRNEDKALAKAECEIKLKRQEIQTKIEAIQRGEFDADLTRSIVQQASQIQITSTTTARPRQEAEGVKRERTIITRPPLFGLIKSKSKFRFINKSKTYTCWSENGGTFTDQEDGRSHKSLASWTVSVIKRGGGGGRKVSAYEVVEVFLKESNEWKKWGDVYGEECTGIN